MSAMLCPNCSAKTSKAAGKPYCRSCGWNILAAERPFHLNLWAYIFLAAIIVMVLKAEIFNGVRLVVSAGLIVLGGIAYLASVLFLRHFRILREKLSIGPYQRKSWLNIEWISKVQGAGSNPGGDSASRAESHVDLICEVNRTEESSPLEAEELVEPASAQMKTETEKFRRLGAIPLPRPVRMTDRGLVLVVLSVVAILAGYCLLGFKAWESLVSNSSTSEQHRWLLIETILWTAIWIRSWRNLRRELHLFAEGEIALGRVMNQETGRAGSSITFYFADAKARAITGAGIDRSRQYYEGMGTVVFYDRADSAKNVAEPCALFKIDTRKLAHKPDELGPQG